MTHKMRIVRNPLTVVAIFAGLAEVSGTCVLPILDGSLQSSFVWFLMLFPAFLVTLFFLTLNLNHKVLYAPSDFRNEANFMRLFETGTAEEREQKIQEEIREASPTPLSGLDGSVIPVVGESTSRRFRPVHGYIDSQTRVKYFVAEQLVLDRLQAELRVPVQRDLVLSATGNRFVFDGAFVKDEALHVVEVKYYPGNRFDPAILHRSLSQIERLKLAPELRGVPLTVILAVVTDLCEEDLPSLGEKLQQAVADVDLPIHVRLYNLESLENSV